MSFGRALWLLVGGLQLVSVWAGPPNRNLQLQNGLDKSNRSGAPPSITYYSGPCPKGIDYNDGCSGASTDAAPFPDILNGYKAPPPWNVAGVHLAVGLSSQRRLKDPAVTPLPFGCSFSGATVTCSGTVTLDAYDFSLHGGITLVVAGGDVVIQNCLFIVGANQGALGKILDVSGTTNATFINNEFDGADIHVTPQRGQTISVTNAGKITFRYNYFHNSGGDMIDFAGGPQVTIIQFNLFKDIGLKTAHSDTLQWCGSVVKDSDLSFNTIVQTLPGLSGMGLLTINSECGGAEMSNVLVHNNTLISKMRDNFATGANVTQDAGPATASRVAVFENYVDPSGIINFTSSPWFPTGFYGSTLPHPSALHSLRDMRTGSTIRVPSKWKRLSVSSNPYYVYPDASGYTPALSDVYSITAWPFPETLTAGQVIIFSLDMDEPWEVTGTPKLLLNSGGAAEYIDGSGTATLRFSYTIKRGQKATDLAITAVNLSDGMISDAFGNHANLAGAMVTFRGLNVR